MRRQRERRDREAEGRQKERIVARRRAGGGEERKREVKRRNIRYICRFSTVQVAPSALQPDVILSSRTSGKRPQVSFCM